SKNSGLKLLDLQVSIQSSSVPFTAIDTDTGERETDQTEGRRLRGSCLRFNVFDLEKVVLGVRVRDGRAHQKVSNVVAGEGIVEAGGVAGGVACPAAIVVSRAGRNRSTVRAVVPDQAAKSRIGGRTCPVRKIHIGVITAIAGLVLQNID